MSSAPRWDNGLWNVICDSCGRQFKASELQLRWDGLMVCQGDWEPRHPQDFVRGEPDIQAPPFVRSEPQDEFIYFCTPMSGEGISDYGTADCARADTDYGIRPECTTLGSTGVSGYAVAGCSVAGRPQPGA